MEEYQASLPSTGYVSYSYYPSPQYYQYPLYQPPYYNYPPPSYNQYPQIQPMYQEESAPYNQKDYSIECTENIEPQEEHFRDKIKEKTQHLKVKKGKGVEKLLLRLIKSLEKENKKDKGKGKDKKHRKHRKHKKD